MSHSAANRANSRKVPQTLQAKKKISKSWYKLPALWILLGAVFAMGSAITRSWIDITDTNSIPLAPSVAPQNDAAEPKMPSLSPYVPVIGT